jgi:hypothetical protein
MDDRTPIRDDADPHREQMPDDDPDRPSVNPAVTTSAGAAGGLLAGAAAGTLTAGPIGTIIGALVGAVGGGWAGLATGEAVKPTEEDEEYYRTHYQGATAGTADAAYERARPAYHLGHVAALNPDYRSHSFDEIEADLRRGWTDDVRTRHGDWTAARPYVRAAYERGLARTNAGPASRPVDQWIGTTPSHDRASFSDPLPSEERP